MENKKEEATYTATPVPGEDYSLISVESNMTVKQVKVDVYSSESIERIEAAREEIRKELLCEKEPSIKKSSNPLKVLLTSARSKRLKLSIKSN